MADCHQVSHVAGGGFTLKNHLKNSENRRRPPSDRTSTVSFHMKKMNQNQGIAIPIDAVFFLVPPGNGKR
jgi:hypothetical protein